jgi:hypothetical protein
VRIQQPPIASAMADPRLHRPPRCQQQGAADSSRCECGFVCERVCAPCVRDCVCARMCVCVCMSSGGAGEVTRACPCAGQRSPRHDLRAGRRLLPNTCACCLPPPRHSRSMHQRAVGFVPAGRPLVHCRAPFALQDTRACVADRNHQHARHLVRQRRQALECDAAGARLPSCRAQHAGGAAFDSRRGA